MIKFLSNRFFHIFILIVLVTVILVSALHRLAVEEHEKYSALSLEQRIRRVEIPARRGEILDSEGNVLAKNEIGYSIKLNSSFIPGDSFADQCIKMYDFFAQRGEKQLEFPIFIEDGIYKYRFDENIKKWLVSSGYEEDWSARDVFEYEKSTYLIDKNLSDYEAMNLLLSISEYLPISTVNMKFTEEIEKENFLSSYGLDADTPPKQAFEAIRKLPIYRISDVYSPEDAYKILVFRHAINEKGDLKYEPIEIAPHVSLETAVLISERGYEFPGLYSDFKTNRVYTGGDLVSHIVGYIGKIATEQEIAFYIEEKKYNRNDFVGKTGIEYMMDDTLHGKTGYKYIEADVTGKYIGDVDSSIHGLHTENKGDGKDIKLTVNLKYQAKLKKIIKEYIDHVRAGELVKDKWGSYQTKPYPNIESAAVAVVDVKTGKILGSYSYPSYDSMVFMNGISKEDWETLSPSNSRNPIAARPLLDMTAMMAVQPGSTYKMVTGYAALKQGLNPHQKIYADGYIEIGQHTFGCWLWNQSHGKHGLINLAEAIRESCNYYFFCVANARDYYNKRPLPFEMNNDILIETTKLFGLGSKTGAEVPELILGVPDVERKVRNTLAMLRIRLDELLADYFDPALVDTVSKRERIVDTIIGWAKENPSRAEIIERLFALGSNPEYTVTEKFADIIKFDYFNMMQWYEGDTMNLAIGQGEHAYTPLQMARYTAMIANGGYPIELTYIDSIDGKPYVKNRDLKSFDDEQLLEYVREGMFKVANGVGFVPNVFHKLPFKVAGKTGSAEKEGLVPPLNEVEYLLKNLKAIAPDITPEALEEETMRVLKYRSEEMSRIEAEIAELEAIIESRKGNREEQHSEEGPESEEGHGEEENHGGDGHHEEHFESEEEERLHELRHKFADILSLERLNKGDAMREAIKNLSGKKITDEDIDRFRLTYDSFSWFVCYAPYDNPEIAVAVLVPQGGEGHNASVLARDAIVAYYGLDEEEENEKNKNN
ncbi:MAG: penicillin-binding transpeptidase domain-containing protein [Bacillota bacterium]|nr:penicillin-binding transpeptidase domain-containing protein [Bacillota bacterium]